MINFFKSFFNKEINPQITAKALQTDIHSHLIPGIDDGAQNFEESKLLCDVLVHLGYTKFITTPHINMNFPNTASIIQYHFESIREYLEPQKIIIEYAAEYMLDEGFNFHLKNGLLSFGKKKYVLIETSHHIKPERFKDIIFDIQMKGYKPVLAHPERYLYLWNSKEKYYELKELGLFFQLNLNSLTGYYTDKPKNIAKFLLKNKLIDFVGSDTHHLKHIEMLEKSLVDENFIAYLNVGKLLNSTL